MEFLAFSDCGDSVHVSYDSQDVTAGVLGTVITSQPPIGESETRAKITEVAYAFLGRDPTATIYITDSQNRLLEIVLNQRYHKEMETRGTLLFRACLLLIMCVVCFVATLAIGLHWGGFGLFIFVALLHIASVRLGINNEVESAILCMIILLLILVLVPMVRSARDRTRRPPDVKQIQGFRRQGGHFRMPLAMALDRQSQCGCHASSQVPRFATALTIQSHRQWDPKTRC